MVIHCKVSYYGPGREADPTAELAEPDPKGPFTSGYQRDHLLWTSTPVLQVVASGGTTAKRALPLVEMNGPRCWLMEHPSAELISNCHCCPLNCLAYDARPIGI